MSARSAGGVCSRLMHPTPAGGERDLITAQLRLTGLSDDLLKNCIALSILGEVDS